MVCRLPYQSRTELRKHTHSLIRRYNSGGGQTELLDAWSWLTRAKIWRSKISDSSYRESWKTAKTRPNFCAMMPFPAECRKRGKCIYINDLAWREERKKLIFWRRSRLLAPTELHTCACVWIPCVSVCVVACASGFCVLDEKRNITHRPRNF